jgi:hypothetical protein
MDKVIVFDRNGMPLDELNVSVKRHLKLDHVLDFDRGSFNIGVSDPKATEKNLRRNNFIYVTSDQPGILPWAAIIWYDENNGLQITRDSQYVVTLRGAEWVLAQRYTEAQLVFQYAYGPGDTIYNLIKEAQRSAPWPAIQLSQNLMGRGGQSCRPAFNFANIYETVNKLTADNQFYFRFIASRDMDDATSVGTGKLVLQPYSRAKIGRQNSFVVSARSGGGNASEATNLVGGRIMERTKKPYANQIIAYGKMDNWTDGIVYKVDNVDAQGETGVVQYVLPVMTAGTIDDLVAPAKAELRDRSHRLYVDGELTNVSKYPNPGDTGIVAPDYQGATWLADKYGNAVHMQVTETNYDPQSNKMAVVFEGLMTDE